jgi:hypothetical protein
MTTITLILIGVISLLVNQNKLMREVFYWLAAEREHSMFFFPPKMPKMSAGRWWAGKGGVVDEGGNVVNDTDEKMQRKVSARGTKQE